MKFVFDLDGTLSFDYMTIDEEIKQVLLKAEEYGHELVFASARSYRDCLGLLGTELSQRLVIGLNGGVAYYLGKAIYEVASIPEKFIKNFKKEEVTKHFFQTLQEHGYRIGKSHQTIYARLAKEKIAHYLEVEKGHAILGLTQVSYFDDGTAFEYVKSQYVGERFEFYLENN